MKMAAKKHYDVIPMDIKMPGMDWFPTFREIEKRDPQAKVILITGYALKEPAREAVFSGAHTVLAKPVDRDEPLRLMNSVAG